MSVLGNILWLDGRGTYGHIPFTSVWGTFLVVKGDSVDMGQKTVVSICRRQ